MSPPRQVASLPVVPAADLADLDETRRWLIEPLWAFAGVGIVGGAPKCCKSWLGLDMALSVASATPCLDAFPVLAPGPVLLYMAEDAGPVSKPRLAGLCHHRGIRLADVPVSVITSPSLRLDLAADQRALSETARLHRPRLLVLDPFVRLHRIDENDAGQVSAVLAFLRTLQREHDLAVAIVHHTRKNGASAGQPGNGLRGSGDFHAWGDSNLYLRRQRDQILLAIEHRASAAVPLQSLTLSGTQAATDTHLALVASSAAECPDDAPDGGDLDSAVLAALRTTATPVSRAALRSALRVRNARLGDALARLASAGRVTRLGDTWAATDCSVPVPPP